MKRDLILQFNIVFILKISIEMFMLTTLIGIAFSVDKAIFIVVAIILSCAIMIGLINEFSYYIKIEANNIITKGNFVATKISHIKQYPTSIDLTEVSDIKIVRASLDSQRKPRIRLQQLETFYEFKLKNGKKEWLLITSVSRRDREKIIRVLNKYQGTNYNYKNLKSKEEWR